MVPELLKAWIGGFVRWSLAGIFGHLVAKGIISGENAEMTILWAIGALSALVWSLYQKWRASKAAESAMVKASKPDNGGSQASTFSNRDPFRLILIPLLIGCLVFAQACNAKTTLNKVGPVLVAAVRIAKTEIQHLKDEGLLSQEKLDALRPKLDALEGKTERFSGILASFGEIRPGDIPALLGGFDELARLVSDALQDPALGGFAGNSKPIKALRYVQEAIVVTRAVVETLFTKPQTTTAGNRPMVRQAVRPSDVIVNLPSPPK